MYPRNKVYLKRFVDLEHSNLIVTEDHTYLKPIINVFSIVRRKENDEKSGQIKKENCFYE